VNRLARSRPRWPKRRRNLQIPRNRWSARFDPLFSLRKIALFVTRHSRAVSTSYERRWASTRSQRSRQHRSTKRHASSAFPRFSPMPRVNGFHPSGRYAP
jgi:hypothetical protein